MGTLEGLLEEVRACTLCADLPLGPRPVLRAAAPARLMIIGQAPGTKVHETGVPWDDPSGRRLREWMAIDDETFYDPGRVAIVPMGFCYPGRLERGGDKPPRPECAPTWHQRIRTELPNIELTLLVGSYAQKYYLGPGAVGSGSSPVPAQKTMTKTVEQWRDYLPDILPTPHPSWRTTAWLRKNPWFEAEVLPELRRRVQTLTA